MPARTKRPEPLPEQLLINEVQLLLAEQRTYYALLRTGIAIFTLPLSVIVFLAATRQYHGLLDRPWLATIIIGVLLCVSLLGAAVAYRADRRIRRIHELIGQIRDQNARLAEIII